MMMILYGQYYYLLWFAFLPCVESFVIPLSGTNLHHHVITTTTSTTMIHMVRNIDLPEALVFYGIDSLFHNINNGQDELQQLPLDGVTQLLKECQEIGTPVVCIVDDNHVTTTTTTTTTTINDSVVNNNNNHNFPIIQNTIMQYFTTTHHHPAPNPHDLVECIASLTVQPRSFGGSSGFGRSMWTHPERPPAMQHVVVLCTTTDQCRAARYCGTRCILLEQQQQPHADNNNNNNNHPDDFLADAVVSGWDEIGVDDISTPGSFWLNPPHPRDDDGNRVDDIYAIIDKYETKRRDHRHDADDDDAAEGTTTTTTTTLETQDDNNNDSEIDRILADLDPM
jgi:hypothetical protein